MFKLYKNNMRFFIAASLIIILFDLMAVNSVLYKENDQFLTIGVSIDFMIIIPGLLYFLIYRRLNKKWLSILPIALIGYLALLLLIPNTAQGPLEIVKYIAFPLELLFLCYESYKMYQLILDFRRNRLVGSHPIEALRSSLQTTFNNSKIASLLVHDGSVFYYAMLAWRKKPYVRTGFTPFSYHTNSSWFITILILCKVLLIEGAGVHVLLMHWSHPAAWILSLGNMYLIFLLIADYRAMCLNPVLVSDQEIRIQYGIQMFSYIDMSDIDSVSMVKFEKLSTNELKTSFIPLAIEPNICIHLKSKITIFRLFGKRQAVDRIYLFLDKPHEFQIECDKAMNTKDGGILWGKSGIDI